MIGLLPLPVATPQQHIQSYVSVVVPQIRRHTYREARQGYDMREGASSG
jgi:hypothetical protein